MTAVTVATSEQSNVVLEPHSHSSYLIPITLKNPISPQVAAVKSNCKNQNLTFLRESGDFLGTQIAHIMRKYAQGIMSEEEVSEAFCELEKFVVKHDLGNTTYGLIWTVAESFILRA